MFPLSRTTPCKSCPSRTHVVKFPDTLHAHMRSNAACACAPSGPSNLPGYCLPPAEWVKVPMLWSRCESPLQLWRCWCCCGWGCLRKLLRPGPWSAETHSPQDWCHPLLRVLFSGLFFGFDVIVAKSAVQGCCADAQKRAVQGAWPSGVCPLPGPAHPPLEPLCEPGQRQWRCWQRHEHSNPTRWRRCICFSARQHGTSYMHAEVHRANS